MVYARYCTVTRLDGRLDDPSYPAGDSDGPAMRPSYPDQIQPVIIPSWVSGGITVRAPAARHHCPDRPNRLPPLYQLVAFLLSLANVMFDGEFLWPVKWPGAVDQRLQ